MACKVAHFDSTSAAKLRRLLTCFENETKKQYRTSGHLSRFMLANSSVSLYALLTVTRG